MPCLVTTNVGDTLKSVIDQYYDLHEELAPRDIEEIAKLNKCGLGPLPPFKILVLPDETGEGACNALDYEAAVLAAELNTKGNDPLNQLLKTGRGEQLLAALEFTESLDAHSETKAVFGGAMGHRHSYTTNSSKPTTNIKRS